MILATGASVFVASKYLLEPTVIVKEKIITEDKPAYSQSYLPIQKFASLQPVRMPQAVYKPRVNSYERDKLYDDIVKKYSILTFNLEQQRDTELENFRKNVPGAFKSYEYQAIYDKYRSLKTELSAQQNVEMCEKIGYRCDEANDYKNYHAKKFGM